MVPFESPGPWLLIGTKMVKIGSLLTKLWSGKVNNHFTKQCSPLRTVFVNGKHADSAECQINGADSAAECYYMPAMPEKGMDESRLSWANQQAYLSITLKLSLIHI